MELETRVDVKFTWSLMGIQDFPSGHYTDPDLLIKYGLRTRGPINNPNAQSPLLGSLFSPIAMAFTNAMTRKITISVKDSRQFRVGKLYFIEALGIMGYLIQSDISYVGGTLSKNRLNFAMVRTVTDRPINDILQSPNEVLNFGLSYLNDPIIPRDLNGASKAKENLITLATQVLNTLAEASGNSGATLPMFRYLPTIMDLIVEVEADPNKAKRQQISPSPKVGDNQQQKQNEFTDVYIVQNIGGTSCCASALTSSGIVGDESGGLNNDLTLIQSAAQALPTDETALDGIVPPAGILAYTVLPQQTTPLVSPTFNIGRTSKPLTYIETPFLPALLAESPNNFKMSQVLINKLAAMDLGLKYQFSGGNISNGLGALNYQGFPQLYVAAIPQNDFNLFGSSMLPQDYLDSVHLNSTIASVLEDGPNALLMNPSAGVFANTYFQLPADSQSSNGNVYRFPYGHLIFKNPSGAYTLYRVQGLYNINYVGTGDTRAYRITPYKGAQIITETSAHENISPYADAPTSALYFISPYTDMTPQRMVEVSLGNDIIGFRTKAKANVILNLATENFKNIEGNGHTHGNAIDFCPDYVVGNSESKLQLLPAFHTKFQTVLSQYFSLLPGSNGTIPLRFIKNAVTIYPQVESDPTAMISSISATLYHCEVTDAENNKGQHALIYSGPSLVQG
jgi:hypothetical protein